MENASKALIMAGAVLVAIMIISLGVLIFNKMGGAAKEAANMDEQEIAAFNSKITPYLGENVSGSQVNALLQYCLSVNISANNSRETYRVITINGNATSLDGSSTGITRVPTGKVYYTVNGTADNNGLLTTITINKNP